MSITIILPVYGNSPWLKEAFQSVVAQQSGNWKLLIADDGSDQLAHDWLEAKIDILQDQRIKWVRRPRNLGLFANLNQAIRESDTEWIVILCSDDKLQVHAITYLEQLNQDWPKAGLILSSFESINSDGSQRPADSGRHHDQLRTDTGLVEPQQMIPELLRLGSLNGNLTGMAFSKEQWRKVGPFREDWRHAADWEWLIRASETDPLLLNRSPIASVRTHGQQLSVRNRQSGHECREVAGVVKILLEHPMLHDKTGKHQWAGHVMQFQLWNLLKRASHGDWHQFPESLRAIHNSAGIRQTCLCLLRWMPTRYRRLCTLNTA